jgi:hypothetical protein
MKVNIMKRKNNSVFLGFFIFMFLIFTACNRSQDEAVTFKSLLMEMIYRERLPVSPNPDYTTKQFSSYDRNTIKPGDYNWYANWDRSNFIRIELERGRKEFVMMDTEGPGAIVRFWMTFAGANAGEGILRIYFDGNTKPEIEGTAFDILSGRQLIGEPLSSSVSELTDYKRRGHNLYLPLPYAKSCKITYETDKISGSGGKNDDERVYYNINYRTYTSGTKVTTFKLDDLSLEKENIHLVQESLLNPKKMAQGEKDYETISHQVILSGESFEKVITGSKAISGLSFRLQAENTEQALRSSILNISFDGQQTVWCPIGDFFGTGYQIRPYKTWYTNVDENGLMFSGWVMPFESSCQITIQNTGNQPIELTEGKIETKKWKWDKTSMYFGASWHQYTRNRNG